MTIPSDTDACQQAGRAPLELVGQDVDEHDVDEDYGTSNPLVHCTLDLTAASPFDPAPFDSFRAFLPRDGYVCYHLLDRWGHPLYIGQTGQPRARMRAHWTSKPWIGEVCGIRLFQTVSELTARSVERMHTERYRPLYSQVTLGESVMLDRRWAAEDDE